MAITIRENISIVLNSDVVVMNVLYYCYPTYSLPILPDKACLWQLVFVFQWQWWLWLLLTSSYLRFTSWAVGCWLSSLDCWMWTVGCGLQSVGITLCYQNYCYYCCYKQQQLYYFVVSCLLADGLVQLLTCSANQQEWRSDIVHEVVTINFKT